MKPLAVIEGAGENVTTNERLDPRLRLELLCDDGSLRLFRSEVAPKSDRAKPGDGVLTGAGTINGRPVFCYAQDRSVVGGSLGKQHADSIVRCMDMAQKAGAPVVGFVESGGARMDEGVAALGGYGRIFRKQVELSGKVPQISVISGVSAGGGAYSPALADFVVMAPDSSMFLTGPAVVSEVMGEDVSIDELGGPGIHARNGVSHIEAESDIDAVLRARELLSFLPQRSGEVREHNEPIEPHASDPSESVPSEQRKVYDVREVIAALADGGHQLEVASRYARNIVTSFARIEGRSVGFIANQPRYIGGVIDADASQKAARFVRTCNAFGVPMVVLVDTPGFLPGTRQEQAGVIRHGAKLLHAFAEATVPRLTVVLRKAYGGGFITMNSKDLGSDLALAWPDAEIGVVGAKQAVQIMKRRQIADAPDPELETQVLADEYREEHLGATVAARDGIIDELVEPEHTRDRLVWALQTIGADHSYGNDRGNIPL